jgi:hypothetical protein
VSGLIVVGECVRYLRYVQATSQADYAKRKKENNPGRSLDVLRFVTDYAKADHASRNRGSLADSLKIATSLSEVTMDNIRKRAQAGLDFGKRDSDSAIGLEILGHTWLRFSVDAIAQVAELGDGALDNVPFISANTAGGRTESEVIVYPFGGPGPWLPGSVQ